MRYLGGGVPVDIFSPHTIHLRGRLVNLYVSYNNMVAILDFLILLAKGYLLYNTSNVLWISSYMYLCLIRTHILLLSAEIIFLAIFKICM